MQTGAATVENSMEFPQKTKNGIAFDPAIPLLGVHPKSPETPIQKNLCIPMFIAAQFTIAKQMSGSKNYGTFTQWNSTQQKEGAYTLCNGMDVTGEYYAKWNKPGGEG